MSNTLPEQWQTFIDNLQLPSDSVRAIFEYSLAQLLIEAGEVSGADLALPRPDIGPAQEEMVLGHLRWMLRRETE